jgi:transcriptional regulator with XRE-family HTH domain
MPTDYDTAVSGEVRAAMGRAALNQQQLAISLGWSPNYLSRRLRGAAAWTAADLKQIADLLSVPVADLTSPRLAS